jgi:hypothetical protein
MINYESQSEYRPEHLSIYDLAHIEEILSEPVRYDWFAAELLRICRKADHENLRKLAYTFPDIVTAYCYYMFGKIPEDVRTSLVFPEYYEYWIPKLMGKAGK